MRWLIDLWFRLRAIIRPRAADRELHEEFAFHLEMEARKLVARGVDRDEALRQARRRFGPVASQQEEVRDSWGIGVVRDFFADLHHAGRQFLRRPAFSVLGVTTLALGLGGTIALSSVIRALLVRPLPVRDEASLSVFWQDFDWTGAEFDFVKERKGSFLGIAAYSTVLSTFREGGASSVVPSGIVTAELFDVLGARPLLGRTFATGEDRPGAESVVVLSWGVWQQEFGGVPDILGKRLVLDGAPTTVIGVMPRGFYFPTPEYRAWRPLLLDPASPSYQNGWLTLVGRQPHDATPALVAQTIHTIAAALGGRFTYPAAWDKTKNAYARPLREYLLGDIRPALVLLLFAVAMLLVMASTNVAALVLARTTDRKQEMAVRAALGAGRGRLARQIVTESIALSLLAGLAGAGLAVLLFNVLLESLPLPNGFAAAVSLDWTTFAVALGLALLVGLLVSTAPVRTLLRGQLQGVGGARGVSGAGRAAGRVHSGLVAVESTIAVLLVVGAALLIRSVDRLYALELGFDPRGVVAIDMIASGSDLTEVDRRRFYREVTSGASRVRGVLSAGLVNRLPVRDGGWQSTVQIEGRPDLGGTKAPNSVYRVVTPDYFRAMGMSIRRGRGFTDADRAGSQPVALISEAFARLAWPGQDPIGRRVKSGFTGDTAWVTVVGIVGETRLFNVTGTNPLAMYVPHEQAPQAGEGMVLVMRATGAMAPIVSEVRGLMRQIDSRTALFRVTTLDEVVATALAEPLRLRFFLSLFAGLALVLGVVGVYGVVSYSVAQRRNEFGVRMALGAAPRGILAEVIRTSILPVAIGTGAGLILTLLLSGLVSRFLYGVAPTDPASFLMGAGALLLSGVVAATIPALRAARVSPVEALRGE